MSNAAIQRLQHPFANQKHRLGTVVAVAGSLDLDDATPPGFPVPKLEEIIVDLVDSTGRRVDPPGERRFSKKQVEYRPGLGEPGLPRPPSMFYAYLKLPDLPGAYRVRSNVLYAGVWSQPETRAITILSFPGGGPALALPPDRESDQFQMKIVAPVDSARGDLPIQIECTTKTRNRTYYITYWIMDRTDSAILGTTFVRDWIARDNDYLASGSIELPPPIQTLPLSAAVVSTVTNTRTGSVPDCRVRAVLLKPPPSPPGRASGTAPSAAASTRAAAPAASSAIFPGVLVDPNVDPALVLESLPTIGPRLAKLMVRDRPFSSVEDLDRVPGVGKARVERLRPLISLQEKPGAKPKAEPPHPPELQSS